MLGALLSLAAVPPCAPKVCPMQAAAMSGGMQMEDGHCQPLDADCCQKQGESPSPAAGPLPGMLLAAALPAGSAAALAADAPPAAPEAAPAILQGVGLHTLLAVFLI